MATLCIALVAGGAWAQRPAGAAGDDPPGPVDAYIADHLTRGDAFDALRLEFGSRYAGSFSMGPRHTVVRLKGRAPVPERLVELSDGYHTIEFIPGAKFTPEEAQAVLSAALEASRCRSLHSGVYSIAEDEFLVFVDTLQPTCGMPASLHGIPVRLFPAGRPQMLRKET